MKSSGPRHLWVGLLASIAWAVCCLGADEGGPTPLAKARGLYQQGIYAEAQEAFEALAANEAVAAAVGVARCQEATGQREKAVATLTAAAEKQPRAAALPAELARLALERGDHAAATKLAATALELAPDNVLARRVRGELYAANGELDKAQADYQALVSHYNEHEVKDPDDLHCIGLAAGEAARWNRQSDQFGFLVNEFYPDLLALDAANWQAQYESGRLFAEKYNQAEASKAFKAALAINPNAAEVQVALGELALEGFELRAAEAAVERALEINPQLLGAHLLKADIYLANFEPRNSVGVLQDALKLNPRSEEALGRLAAAYAAVDGPARRPRHALRQAGRRGQWAQPARRTVLHGIGRRTRSAPPLARRGPLLRRSAASDAPAHRAGRTPGHGADAARRGRKSQKGARRGVQRRSVQRPRE